jgi:general secretion pathway protein G
MTKNSLNQTCQKKAASRLVSDDSGFTLVELLVVLAIIGLVAAMATPQVLRYLASAKVSTTQAQLANIGSALELFYLDTGSYPTAEAGLEALVKAPAGTAVWNGPYLRTNVPLRDGWGNEFKYSIGSQRGVATVISFGRDGKPDGEGADADLAYKTQ